MIGTDCISSCKQNNYTTDMPLKYRFCPLRKESSFSPYPYVNISEYRVNVGCNETICSNFSGRAQSMGVVSFYFPFVFYFSSPPFIDWLPFSVILTFQSFPTQPLDQLEPIFPRVTVINFTTKSTFGLIVQNMPTDIIVVSIYRNIFSS